MADFLGLNEAAVAALKFVPELGVHQHLSNAWNELTERLRRLNGRRPSISRCCICRRGKVVGREGPEVRELVLPEMERHGPTEAGLPRGVVLMDAGYGVDTGITGPRPLWREKRGDALIVFSSLRHRDTPAVRSAN